MKWKKQDGSHGTDKSGKSPWRFLFLGLIVLGGLELLGNLAAWGIVMSMQMAPAGASVGVIGGADGPTAVFVTGPGWIWLLRVLSVAVGITGYLRLRKCNK